MDPDDGRDRYDKAERYNQGELERVQRIPKKEVDSLVVVVLMVLCLLVVMAVLWMW